ncbi:MAG: response regulator [Campylobacterota bacterium]|nr:response regulator [Campylobacterota bacterium]
MNIEHLKNQKVLYVEDDVAIMSSFSKILQKVFGEVITAVNGKEGLELFKKNLDTSFIITDIKMPKMDGLDMVKEIKTINPKVPCILTTAHGEYDYFLRADEVGVYRYIQKPINISELLKSISEYKPER